MIINPDLSQGKPFPVSGAALDFSPGELLLKPEMKRTMKLLSGTPRRGVHYVRPHYMLNTIRAFGVRQLRLFAVRRSNGRHGEKRVCSLFRNHGEPVGDI